MLLQLLLCLHSLEVLLQDGFVDNYNGIDSRNDDGFPEDTNGHGTHCSGTIAASGNDDFPHVGVAYNVLLQYHEQLQIL